MMGQRTHPETDPGMTDVANCRSCKAPIIWCRTSSGKNMPVDADPDERGDFFLSRAEDGKLDAFHVRRYPGKMPEDVERYTSHFATCEDANQFRRPRG
jgi:hypothetical protein